ncbi:MAG TPA: hypothetical protein G4N95_00970 [Anaerolineae bacterium]|nr:hypothetical protein [Anaerolineae bacterium]
MSDLFEKITGDQDIFKKIANKIPGFNGYIERQDRRAADKILRETIAAHFEGLYEKVSSLQEDFISQGEIMYVDDLEKAAIKLRTFIDRIKTASYGYSGFFDSIKLNEEELKQIYEYDLKMVDLEDEVLHAIENVEESMGSDGIQAAIRNLIQKASECVEIFNRRDEVVTQG